MKKQVSKISIHQSSKVVAILQFIISALIFVPVGIFTLLFLQASEALLLFFAPFLYLIFGYIFFAFFSWLYNHVAASFGGMEFTITDVEKKEIE